MARGRGACLTRFLVRELGGLAVWDCVFLRNCPGIASVKGSAVTPAGPGLVIIGVVLVRAGDFGVTILHGGWAI